MSRRRPIVLYGAGGHARSVIEGVEAGGLWEIVGLLADLHDADTGVPGYEVLGGSALLPDLAARGVFGGFAAVGDNAGRLRVLSRFRDVGLEVVNVVHPTALVMDRAVLGVGCFLHAYAVVGADSVVGDGGILSAHVSVGHQSHLGDGVHLTPGARIGGRCRIGDRSTFGPGAVLYAERRVGNDVEVLANSVVTKDVGDAVVVGGIPARVMKPNIG